MAGSTSGPKGALFGTTYLAGAAIVTNRIVKRGADVNSVVIATAAAVPLGVAMDNQDTVGKSVLVAHRPGERVTVQSGAAVALDAFVTSDATGRCVLAATGNPVVGRAREAATAADQLIDVELMGGGLLAP